MQSTKDHWPENAPVKPDQDGSRIVVWLFTSDDQRTDETEKPEVQQLRNNLPLPADTRTDPKKTNFDDVTDEKIRQLEMKINVFRRSA